MIVIAHRGCTKATTENSWSAFQAAIEAKSDRIELDLQMTRDKNLVVMHDNNLGRTSLSKGKISSMSIHQLRKIRLKNGEKVPEFTEIIEKLLPKIEINAEIKGSGTIEADIAGELLSRSSQQSKIIFSSFHEKPLLLLKDKYPQLQRAVLWGKDTIRIHPFYFIHPLRFLKKCETVNFHPMASMLNKPLMWRLKQNGIQVYPWIAMGLEEDREREKLWSRLLTLGIDGLCTNKPGEFRKWTDERSCR